jgi:hypothetical protein
MHLTWMGWLFLPLVPVLVVLAPRRLYPLMVFLIPFSATAVANVGTREGGSGVQPYLVLGALWVVTESLVILRRGWVRLPSERNLSVALLMAFGVAALASLIMPVIIDGSLVIQSPELLSDESTPLHFTWRHITQGLYLMLGVALAVLVAIRNADPRARLRTLKISTLAAVFVSAWGWLQWLCYRLGVAYPYAILNNSITKSAVGYDRVIEELGIPRVSSVAVEPSILAQYLLTVFPLLLLSVLYRRTVWSPRLDRIALALVSSTLLISTSASAYIGLAIALALTIYVAYRTGMLRPRHAAMVLTCATAGVVVYATSSSVRASLSAIVFTKAATYSGAERVSSVLKAWGYFTQYPLLGVGWGSVTSHDLVIKLLANTGVLGLVCFSLFAGYTLTRLRPSRAPLLRSDLDGFWRAGVFITMATLLALSVLTGFAYVFGHVWLVFGLAIAVASARRPLRQERPEAQSLTGLSTAR